MKRTHRFDWTPWLFLAPSLACVTLFVLLPFGDALRRSFYSAMNSQFVGLKNYGAVLENAAFQLAAYNTLRFTVICIPLLLLFSFLLTLAVAAVKERRGVLKTSFLFPMAIPVASIVLLWRVLFDQHGLLNAALVRLGGEPIHWLQSEWAFAVLVLTYLWKNVGYDMVLWLSGLSSIAPSLYEAAQVDGAGRWQQLRHITLPCLRSTLFTTAVLSLLCSFKVFREAYLLAGERPHNSIYLLQHLFNNWFLTLDVDKMCAAAVLMAAAVLLVILLMWALWEREDAPS